MDRTRIESVARFGWIGAAAIVAILVFQVAQPWRGYLAGWLVFVVSGAWVAHQVSRHRASQRTDNHVTPRRQVGVTDIPGRWRQHRDPSSERQGQPAPGGLTIVSGKDQLGGRHTMR